MRTVNVRPIEVGGSRYLLRSWATPTGPATYVRPGRGSSEGGSTGTIRGVEVEGDERAAAVAYYLATSTYGPTKRLLTNRLPDPEDHPVFRIE